MCHNISILPITSQSFRLCCIFYRYISLTNKGSFSFQLAIISMSFVLSGLIDRCNPYSFFIPSFLIKAFCRMSAVWGGVYMLRQTILSLHILLAAVSEEQNDLCAGGTGEVRKISGDEKEQRSEECNSAVVKNLMDDDRVKESEYSTSEQLTGEIVVEENKGKEVVTPNDATSHLQSEVNLSSPKPLQPVPRLLSMVIGASTARPYSTDLTTSSEPALSESSSGSTSNSKSRSKFTEEEDRVVRCATCLVEASRVPLPFSAVRAALASRVLVCRIGRREGAGVGELGVAKSR